MKRVLFVILFCMMTTGVFRAAAQDATPEATPEYATPAELADADGKFADVNGASVYYIERGPSDSPAVLLLHGFLGSVIDWTNVLDVLVDAGYHTIAFDRPPFGLSDKSTKLDYTLDGQAALTAGLMDALGIQKATLVGHSAGGPIAADFALLYPDRVEKLVLVAAAIGITAEDASKNEGSNPFAGMSMLATLDPESQAAQNLIRRFINSDFAQNLLNAAYYDVSNVDLNRIVLSSRGLRIKGWEGGLLAYAKTMADSLNTPKPEQLAVINVPTLILWGEEDKIVPITVGERLREEIPGAIWITYPKTGHLPMDEATDDFNRDLLAFLSK
jgi:pimeloyl-ACP methyl ester carboxylesterase